MRSFKDSSLRTGHLYLDIISAMEPRAVNPEMVTSGEIYEDQILNARYAITLARKIGACVFLTPEDIVEGNTKMTFTFLSSLWLTEMAMGVK